MRVVPKDPMPKTASCFPRVSPLPPGENYDSNTEEEDDSSLVDDEGGVIQSREEPAMYSELVIDFIFVL